MEISRKIKDLRLSSGLTLDQLAQLTGFTKGYLSKIERSPKIPPFATVQVIADALQVDMADLLAASAPPAGSRNIDLQQQPDLIRDDLLQTAAVYSFKPLLSKYQNKYMSPFLFMVKTGATELTSHDSEEFVYVLEGKVELNYEGQTYALKAGDCFYLDARLRHNFVNTNSQPAILLAVHHNYRRF